MTKRPNVIHVLSCSRMFFDLGQAKQLARSYGVHSAPIIGGMVIIFMNGFAVQFENIWTDRRQGYFFLRGDCDEPQWSNLLHQRSGQDGLDTVEAEKAEVSGSE